MNIYKKVYTTADGSDNFFFSFEQQSNGTWRVYIERIPYYGDRSTEMHATHILTDGARKYICWDHPIQTFNDAANVAALWAEKTQNYIKTGQF